MYVNGHVCNNFVHQSKEEQVDCNQYGKQDDFSFAHNN